MTKIREVTILIDEFKDAFINLIEFYEGTTPDLCDATSLSKRMNAAASIGFCAVGLRGVAMLFTDASQVAELHGPPDASFEDWFGELANQGVGRFKNKIAEYGVLVNIGLPSTMRGQDLRPSGRHYMAWETKWNGFEFFATLQTEVEDALQLTHDPAAKSAAEGSFALF